MDFRTERLRDNVSQCDRLVRDYFDRTTAKDGMPDIEMDWLAYCRLEELHKLYLWVARDEDKAMMGFAMYVVMFNPHYRTKLFAECDIIAVRPEMRGKGIASTLVECAEHKFRRLGVVRMFHKMRMVYGDTEPLFPKLGFVECERTYMKVF